MMPHRAFVGVRKPRAEPHFSDLELRIMELLFNCSMTAKALAELIGRPVGTVRPRLREMERKRAVKPASVTRVGKREETVWTAVL